MRVFQVTLVVTSEFSAEVVASNSQKAVELAREAHMRKDGVARVLELSDEQAKARRREIAGSSYGAWQQVGVADTSGGESLIFERKLAGPSFARAVVRRAHEYVLTLYRHAGSNNDGTKGITARLDGVGTLRDVLLTADQRLYQMLQEDFRIAKGSIALMDEEGGEQDG